MSEKPLSRVERRALGKTTRAKVPLDAHTVFEPAPGRDPVGLLLAQADTRVPELVPIRHGRMLVSPFTFYRGAALPMAADLAGRPRRACGSSCAGTRTWRTSAVSPHPERRLVFDVNDFDETLPGPFEWDVKRLAASLSRGRTRQRLHRPGAPQGRPGRRPSYRTAMREFARMPTLDVWYAHLEVEEAIAKLEPSLAKRGRKRLRRPWPRPAPETACRRSASSPPSWTDNAGSSATHR